jgi:putative ABC transport system permease protein
MPKERFSSMTVVSATADALRLLVRILGMALRAILAHRLRSSFVILGVALGIASLTIIVAAVDGAERKAYEILDSFGPDAVFILGGDIRNRAVGQRTNTLTYADAEVLRRSLPGVYLVVPMRAQHNLPVRFENNKTQVDTVVGATAGYAEVWNWPLTEGRDFSAADITRATKVCLIGDTVAEELFGTASPVGRTIYIDKLPVQVIGRLSYRGFSGGGGSVDERIILPITTLTQRFNLNRHYFRALRVKFSSTDNMAFQVENLRSLLRRQHQLSEEQPDDFTILTADEILRFLSTFKGGLLLFLGITAAVAILVGGFVLANLFYLSVDERRAEIGLKKALGAKSSAVLLQFLSEAVMLTLLGSLLGMALGMGLAQLLERLGIMEIFFSWKVFAYAVAAALGIGILFGLRPARKAAALVPIEVLKG